MKFHHTSTFQCEKILLIWPKVTLLVCFYQDGKIVGKRGLKRFTETGCVFEDGSEANDIDLVILATGFHPNLDIIDVPDIKGDIKVKFKTKCAKIITPMSSFKLRSCNALQFLQFPSLQLAHSQDH